MRRAVAALLGVVCAVLLAGCSLAPAPDVTTTPDTDGVSAELLPYYGQRVVWRDCRGGFRCATVRAPEDWSDPGGARISLSMIMHPASGNRIGSLFTNPGGPGVSGVHFLRSAIAGFYDQTLLDHYDLISWDPRGVGDSAPVDCYGTAGLDRFLTDDPDLPAGSPALRADVVDQDVAFGKACLARTGSRLEHVGTADTVQDLDMMRAAVGEPRLDYFGFSYGTYIGALYADRFGPRVGRMVLDGAVDPSISTFQESLANTKAFGAALQAYLASCLKASSCPFAGSSVGAATDRIASLLVRLRASPLRAADGRQVNSVVVRTAIDASLYDTQAWPGLTTAFVALLRGRPDPMQQLADAYFERGADGYTGNLFEAFFAIGCLDKPVTTDRATLQEQGKQLDAADPLRAADNTNDLGDPVCGNWPIAPEGKVARVTAAGAPPIVVLGTTGDPATPYAWAQSLAGQLPGGVLLTLRGQGHTAYRDGVACINDPVDRFFVSGTVPRPVTCG